MKYFSNIFNFVNNIYYMSFGKYNKEFTSLFIFLVLAEYMRYKNIMCLGFNVEFRRGDYIHYNIKVDKPNYVDLPMLYNLIFYILNHYGFKEENYYNKINDSYAHPLIYQNDNGLYELDQAVFFNLTMKEIIK